MWVDESSLRSISSVFPFKCGFCYFAAQEKSTLDFHLQLEHDPISSDVHSWLDTEVAAKEERGSVQSPVQFQNNTSDIHPNSDIPENDSVNCPPVESAFNSIPSVAQSNLEVASNTEIKPNINSNAGRDPSFKDEFSSNNKNFNSQNSSSKINPVKVSSKNFSYFKNMAAGKINSPNVFICCFQDCCYQTLIKHELLSHWKKSHGEKFLPYWCLFCQLDFEKRKDCVVHMLIEHCKELYLCQFCCNFFTTEESEWNEHFFKYH